MTVTTTSIETLHETVRQLLSENKVGVVIGYCKERNAEVASPLFVRKPEDAEKLIFDDTCMGNLAVYLAKSEVRSLGRTGIVVKGCDLLAVYALLREHVIERDDVYIIGVCCEGVGNPHLPKCSICEVHNPEGSDVLIGENVNQPEIDKEQLYAAAAEIDSLSLEERWDFWKKQMEKCIRCYACRQVCPLCYCKQCIVEKSNPQWVETSPHLRGNLAWNIVRAFHLTGRCISCGECERICPVNIPLNSINQKMSMIMEELFDYRPGISTDIKTPFTTWSPDDPENGIL